jgi:T-complex protein 1 subunit beta
LSTLKAISKKGSEDEASFREELVKIARTVISSKLLTYEKEHFAQLAVNAVLRLGSSSNLNSIQIIKKLGGSLKDSFLDNGFLLEKEISFGCPTRKENPKILVANTPMDYDKIKIFGTRVKANSMDKVAEIETAEKDKMKRKVEKILSYKPDVFINRQLIYDYPEQLMIEKGITVIEHADFEGVERLVLALGGEIVSTFDDPSKANSVLGQAELMEEIMIGESKLIRFSGCRFSKACSVVLRGSSQHLLDEAERSLHDALCVLSKIVQDRNIILGGGNSELSMAIAVEDLANKVKGKKALAIQGFAKALKAIPTIIADNGGYDSSELVQNILYELRNGKNNSGLNMTEGSVDDMEKLGIYESHRVKEQAVISATEAAEMILRVDDIIHCAPRQRTKHGVHN